MRHPRICQVGGMGKATRPVFSCLGATLLAFATLVSSASGQEAKEVRVQYARGKPDTVLSGIDVCNTPMWKVFAKLGKPDRIEHPGNEPDFIWEQGGVKLIVSEYAYLEGLVPNFVQVSGKAPVGPIGRTGRGLALGASLADIRQIYGRHFPVDVYRGVRHVSVLWKDSGDALYITLDKNNRVDRIELHAGDCNPP